ncbi:LysR family transcriptional regulator [Catenulispora subtropica]|uniref:LysR family transcriptional regulator n=1 Tax=Catenulispora subtropica TaxID=450798 RepID=A0ABP5EUF0_9ACTN
MIDIDVRYLRSFLTVAEELNVTRAASRLHLTQQAVSTHIQQLERTLQVLLLVRTSRGVLLTEAGRELASGGQGVVSGLTELAHRVRAVAAGQGGQVRLACCPYATDLFAVEVADAMEAAFPGLEVALTSVPTPRRELAELSGGRADAAFMWLPVGDVGLHHAVIRTDRRAVAVATGHRLAERSAVSLTDLADEPVIHPDVLTSPEAQRFWAVDPRPDGTPAPPGPTVPGTEDCLLAVARGRGVWMAPEPLSRVASTGGVRWIPVTDAGTFDLAVVWTDNAPEALIARMIAEVRVITGYQRLRVA